MKLLSNQRRAQLMTGPYARLLARNEQVLEESYRLFGEILPRHQKFWFALANAEREHRNLVLELEERMKAGEFSYTKPSYQCHQIEEATEWVEVVKARVERDGTSMLSALQMAADFEKTIIEARFFEILDQDSADTRHVFKVLQESTIQHARWIDKEAAALKWKILGRRVHKMPPTALAAVTDLDDIRRNIRDVQAELIDLMIMAEEAAADLYRAYGNCIQVDAAFWMQMADEEIQHAAMLKKLHAILDQGDLFANLDRFDKETLRNDIKATQEAEADTRYGITLHKALHMALKIEHSLLERGFYETARTDAPEFKIIAQRLKDHTNAHIGRLQAEMERANELDEVAENKLWIAVPGNVLVQPGTLNAVRHK